MDVGCRLGTMVVMAGTAPGMIPGMHRGMTLGSILGMHRGMILGTTHGIIQAITVGIRLGAMAGTDPIIIIIMV